MKKNIDLERCFKCKDSKVILREILFYGKTAYICLDCRNLSLPEDSKIIPEIYYPFTRHWLKKPITV